MVNPARVLLTPGLVVLALASVCGSARASVLTSNVDGASVNADTATAITETVTGGVPNATYYVHVDSAYDINTDGGSDPLGCSQTIATNSSGNGQTTCQIQLQDSAANPSGPQSLPIDCDSDWTTSCDGSWTEGYYYTTGGANPQTGYGTGGSFTVDSVAPQQPTITSPTAGQALDGTAGNDQLAVTEPAGDESDILTAVITEGGQPVKTVAVAATADSDPADATSPLRTTIDLGALPAGSYVAAVTPSNAVGSGRAADVSFTVQGSTTTTGTTTTGTTTTGTSSTPSTPTAPAPATTTFTNPGESTYTVPAGVDEILVTAIGGQGGGGANAGCAGGIGSEVTSELPVSPGQTLYVEVGVGGGGAGSSFFGSPGGNGGGESDVRTASATVTSVVQRDTRLIVAGGGGGGGGNYGGCSGGSGGPVPSGGSSTDESPGGGAGTATAGGSTSAANRLVPELCVGDAIAGSLGQGGSGAACGDSGGGGGGGYYGGGGGGGGFVGAGGGAGSNEVELGSTDTSITAATQGNPEVIIKNSAPTATISGVTSGATYAEGQVVPTHFTCADPYGTGISRCVDSNGATAGTGVLHTSTPGADTYDVLAISGDGEVSTTSVSYNVAPPVTTSTSVSGASRIGSTETVTATVTNTTAAPETNLAVWITTSAPAPEVVDSTPEWVRGRGRNAPLRRPLLASALRDRNACASCERERHRARQADETGAAHRECDRFNRWRQATGNRGRHRNRQGRRDRAQADTPRRAGADLRCTGGHRHDRRDGPQRGLRPSRRCRRMCHRTVGRHRRRPRCDRQRQPDLLAGAFAGRRPSPERSSDHPRRQARPDHYSDGARRQRHGNASHPPSVIAARDDADALRRNRHRHRPGDVDVRGASVCSVNSPPYLASAGIRLLCLMRWVRRSGREWIGAVSSDRLFELSHSLSEPAAQFGEPLRAEDEQHDKHHQCDV
jgi:hypothetical protein